MFSTEDVQELFQAFPPPKSTPTLLLASSGHGFITQEKLRNQFERRLKEATGRISVHDTAKDLDVQPDVLLHWIQHGHQQALLSSDRQEVVSNNELEVITKDLRQSLQTGAVSKAEYESSCHIKFEDLLPILHNIDSDLVYHDDYVCTQEYEEYLSVQARGFAESAINNIVNIDLRARDLEELRGSPPRWLFLRWLENHADSAEYKERVLVRDMPDLIRVQSKDMEAHMIKTYSRTLRSGDVAYIDLRAVMEHTVFNENIARIAKDFNDLEGIEVVDYLAISETWLSKYVDQKVRALHYKEDGTIDIVQGMTANFRESFDLGLQTTHAAHRSFPEELSSHIERKAEQYLTTAISNTDHRQFGTIVLTAEQYAKEQAILIQRAAEDAASQWQQLKDTPSHELKFAIANITSTSPVHSSLAKEKPLQKACDEHFWSTISSLEASSDADFATFWLERVDSRVQIYNTGLSSITDTKLQAQLSDLLATHIAKELVPDSLAKARALHLVLSRKAKKNVSKLESTLASADPSLPTILPLLSTFHTKQSLASSYSLAETKKAMQTDMLRRMSKPSTSPPVLFLTLIVLLFARHQAGIVYATGKFAPKLMKLLREEVGEEGYARLEGWKEGAKRGVLGEEEREDMRAMAAGEDGAEEELRGE